jgi:hypothetical protein
MRNKTRKLELKSLTKWSFSLVVGAAVGGLLHYLVYRLGLPVEPFVYVAF